MKIPSSCRAALVNAATKTLNISEIQTPEPQEGELLIRVRCAGINRADWYQKKGGYAPPPGASSVLGLELSGEVVAHGHGASQKDWPVGERVMSLVSGGAYAEYCTASTATTFRIPENMSPEEAAAIPEAYMTIWSNLFMEGHLKSGETILVHGGASGVGSASIQIAKAVGARVITTAGSDEKKDFCVKQLGADYGINHRTQDFVEEVKKFTQGEGVDLIFDWIGAAYFERHLQILKRLGRLVVIDSSQGGNQVSINLFQLMKNNWRIVGSVLRPRPLSEKAQIATEVRQNLLPLLSSGKIQKPIVSHVFSLDEAEKAHLVMEQRLHHGKIIVKI